MSDKTDSHKTEEKLCTTAPDKDTEMSIVITQIIVPNLHQRD